MYSQDFERLVQTEDQSVDHGLYLFGRLLFNLPGYISRPQPRIV
jgi:hypothetical protein